MDAVKKTIFVIAFLGISTLGRTVRYKIITNGDGQKQLVGGYNDTINRPELDFLVKDLNASVTASTPHATTIEDRVDVVGNDPEIITADTYKLMNKWNSFTQNGWTKNKNTIYANSTKLEIYDDAPKNYTSVGVKHGRSENITNEESTADTESESLDDSTNSYNTSLMEPSLWFLIDKIYQCFQNSSRHGGTLKCLKFGISSIFLRFLDGSMTSTSRKGYEEKTLQHGKKLLKGALLPLLVLLIIKYLVALPVIAVGLITIKTFWLSLMSAGVAAFGNPWKKGIVPKRYEIEPVWSQPPGWSTVIEEDAKPKNEYYM